MSYIIRDRFWTGSDVLQGNNPPTIQGHQVSNSHQSKKGQIKDYLDLTANLSSIPREIAYRRYSHPLLGGFHTVKNFIGPVQDYLALQYALKKPTEGYIGPTNRPPETPDMTIGRGGTFDIKFKTGSIKKFQVRDTLATALTTDIEVYYNYGDFDDSFAPVAEQVNGEGNFTIEIAENGYPKAYGRCVGKLKLTATGKTAVEKLIAEKRRLNELKYGGKLHISDIVQEVTWFEIMLVANDFTNENVKVFNARETGTGGTFNFIQPRYIHPDMDIPVEHINISVPINKDVVGETTLYTPVPIWDYASITNTYENAKNLKSVVVFPYGKNNITVTITTDATKTVVTDSPIYSVRSRSLMPIVLQNSYKDGKKTLSPHPMIKPEVIKPVRTETTLENGFHFESRGTVTYASEWGGYSDITDAKIPKGKWMPGAYATQTIKFSDDATTKDTIVNIQGIPPGDTDEAGLFVPDTIAMDAVQGEFFSAYIEVVGTKNPISKWAISEGALPEDVKMTFIGNTCILEGVVKKDAATKPYTFKLTATDGNKKDLPTKECTITVVAPKGANIAEIVEDEKKLSTPPELKSISAMITKYPFKGPENLKITGLYSNGELRDINIDDCIIEGPKGSRDELTITSRTNPSISTKIETKK